MYVPSKCFNAFLNARSEIVKMSGGSVFQNIEAITEDVYLQSSQFLYRVLK